MLQDLPPLIQLHVSDIIRSTDWDAVALQLGDLCAGCPGLQSEAAEPPCYNCPLWGIRLDLSQLRLLRRLELGDSSSDKA